VGGRIILLWPSIKPRIDPLGIGLDVNDDCALIDADIRLQAATLAGRLTTDALTPQHA
jgi:hypothetical protein